MPKQLRQLVEERTGRPADTWVKNELIKILLHTDYPVMNTMQLRKLVIARTDNKTPTWDKEELMAILQVLNYNSNLTQTNSMRHQRIINFDFIFLCCIYLF